MRKEYLPHTVNAVTVLAAREIILSGLPNDEAHRRIKALKDSPYAEA